MINIGDRFGKLTVIKEYGYAIYGAKGENNGYVDAIVETK